MLRMRMRKTSRSPPHSYYSTYYNSSHAYNITQIKMKGESEGTNGKPTGGIGHH